jgi:hypothetical protein
MTVLHKRLLHLIPVLWILFSAESVLGQNETPAGPLLPEGLIMTETFRPGLGSPIGRVAIVEGKVVIIHEGEKQGYWAEDDLPLFKGDTIVSLDKGRTRLELKDRSAVTLASGTKIVLTDVLLEREIRSTFLAMVLGKARFLVAKLQELRSTDYKVKTQTAIVGVRGSDFVVNAMPKLTEVTTLEETKLEVVSLAALEVKPTLLEDFQKTTVQLGALPSLPERVAPAVIEQLKRDFVISADRVRPEVKLDVKERKAPTTKAGEPAPKEGGPPEQKGILVPEQELVKPAEPSAQEGVQPPFLAPVVERQRAADQEQAVREQQQLILQERHETTVTRTLPAPSPPATLPSFPGTPE